MKQKHKTKWLDWMVLAGITLFSCALMWSTFNTVPGYLIIDSKLWSDFGAHLPLIRSFSLGDNWPPEYSTYPGTPIRYHFLFYLVVGLLERAGVPLGLALNSLSAAGFALLLWMVYKIGTLYAKKRLAGILAVFLVLMNGSLTFVEFFKQHPLNPQSLTEIVTAEHFTSFAPWDGKNITAFWNLNIYTNQRHLALGFGLALFLLWPLLQAVESRKKISRIFWLGAGTCSFLLPWLHQAGVVVIGIIWLVISLGNFRRVKHLLLPYLGLFLLSAPGMIYWYFSGATPPLIELGFLARDTSVLGLLQYWFENFGFYLPLFPLLFVLAPKRRRVVLTAFLTLFIVANSFRLTTDMINNHKLINFFWIYLCVEAGIFLSHAVKRWWAVGPALVLFIGLTFSGFIDLFPIINDRNGKNPDVDNIPAAAWIRDHTPPDSVFLTTQYFYHPASIAGRKIYVDYGYFNWSMGYPDGERRRNLPQLFSPTLPLPKVCGLLSHAGLDYVMISPGTYDVPQIDPKESTIVKAGIPIYSDEQGHFIYSIQSACTL